MHLAIGWRTVPENVPPIDFPIGEKGMWIPGDPKENGSPVGARKFSQVFVIPGRSMRCLLLHIPGRQRAIRKNEGGPAVLFIVLLHRFVIRDVLAIISVHAATIH